MANTGKKTNNSKNGTKKSASRKQSSSTNRKTTKNSSSKKTVSSVSSKTEPIYSSVDNSAPMNNSSSLFNKFLNSRAFIPTVLLAFVLVVVGLDFLFTLNDYSKFFKVLGIEIIVIGILWVSYLAFNTYKSESSKGNK